MRDCWKKTCLYRRVSRLNACNVELKRIKQAVEKKSSWWLGLERLFKAFLLGKDTLSRVLSKDFQKFLGSPPFAKFFCFLFLNLNYNFLFFFFPFLIFFINPNYNLHLRIILIVSSNLNFGLWIEILPFFLLSQSKYYLECKCIC